jgi:ATP-dependent DNA helicase
MIQSLHKILGPFVLRRLKSVVLSDSDLPSKKEFTVMAPMVLEQRKMYEAILDGKIVEFLEDSYHQSMGKKYGTPISPIPSGKRKRKNYKEDESDDEFVERIDSAQNSEGSRDGNLKLIKRMVSSQNLSMMIMQLRKICNHPRLFYQPEDFNPEESANETLIAGSGKMMVLDQLLSALFHQNQGRKVLIFSQMTKMLDILHDWLENERPQWGVCRIDGNSPQEERQLEIESFNENESKMVF